MLRLDNSRIVVLVLLSFSLLGCITLPGHRQIIDERDFYLRIETPNKAAKNLIRFNAEKPALHTCLQDLKLSWWLWTSRGNTR